VYTYSKCRNTGMPEKCQSGIVSFTVSPAASVRHRHSGIYLSPVPLITDYSGSAQLCYQACQRLLAVKGHLSFCPLWQLMGPLKSWREKNEVHFLEKFHQFSRLQIWGFSYSASNKNLKGIVSRDGLSTETIGVPYSLGLNNPPRTYLSYT
jgi:hypothetical protein